MKNGRGPHPAKEHPMINLSAIESLVLSKVGSKLPESDVAPGNHPFDFVVRVSGVCCRGVDTEKTPTSRGLTKAAIGLFIQRSGLQRDLAIEILLGAMRDAAAMDEKAEEALMEVNGVKEATARFNAELKTLPKTPVKGAVRLRDVTVVSGGVLGDAFRPHEVASQDAEGEPVIPVISVG
jgi:hypothetical protein